MRYWRQRVMPYALCLCARVIDDGARYARYEKVYTLRHTRQMPARALYRTAMLMPAMIYIKSLRASALWRYIDDKMLFDV